MLHGMGANARTNWASQVKALSKHFNLILPDLIYFGKVLVRQIIIRLNFKSNKFMKQFSNWVYYI